MQDEELTQIRTGVVTRIRCLVGKADIIQGHLQVMLVMLVGEHKECRSQNRKGEHDRLHGSLVRKFVRTKLYSIYTRLPARLQRRAISAELHMLRLMTCYLAACCTLLK